MRTPDNPPTSLTLQTTSFALIRVVLNTMHRMVYPFLDVFARGLGVSLSAISMAVTARQLVGVAGPFIASVADSHGRKTGMLLGLLLFTAGASLVLLWPTFPAFVIALLLTLMGKYVFDPAMQAYLGDRVLYERRGVILAVTELGWSLSFILGVPVVGFLIGRYGWRSPFPVLALLGLLSMAALAFLLPKDPSQEASNNKMWGNFRLVLTNPPALAGLAVGLLISAANEVVNLVFGVWMEDAFGLQIAALGAASAVIGLSELGGETLMGIFTDRLGKPLSVGLGIIANGLAALALPWLGHNLSGALIGLFLFYITFEFTLVSIIPLMTEILPATRATLMALNVAGLSFGRAIGAWIAFPLYTLGRSQTFFPGIMSSGMAAFALNLLALFALWRLRVALKGRV